MKRVLRRCLPVTALLLLGLAGCGTETKTVTEILIPECSATNPTGACEAGQTCFGGACVASASLCSPTNLTGTCADGMTCFGGGCVLASALCSPTSPTGPCAIGSTCVEGTCLATASLCSSTNPTGACPSGKVCQAGVCAVTGPGGEACTEKVYSAQPAIGVKTKGKLSVDGLEFRDASGDGALQPYEDWRLAEICRAKDLVSRMSVDEKIGLMSEGGTIGSGTQDGVIAQNVQDNIKVQHLRQGLIRLPTNLTAKNMADYLNNIQAMCEAEPWGIPFVVTADPVHGFGMSTNAATGAQTISPTVMVSHWPYPLGLGAINDATVTRQYGDTVREEFMGMGFRWQLGPMADLATEPRWARVQNVFGENAFHVAKHVKACIEGFQGAGDGGLKNGIAATMKHFPGAGPNEDGKDSHSYLGKWNVFPGNNFEYHQIAFRAAIDAGAAAVMPCYSIFKEQYKYDPEQVGTAYSKGMVTEYLKKELGFSGMVTGDWGVLAGSSHGVESLTVAERAARFVKAGSHQLGSDSHLNIKAAFDQGLLTEEDINGAAEKILEMSFKLGIFENPYTDSSTSNDIVKSVENRTNGFVAQKKAIVLLKNNEHTNTTRTPPRYLPIDPKAFTDKNGNKAPDVGEYTCDTNGDGVIKVYFDGVVDALEGSDLYDDIFGGYDYTSPAAEGALPVVAAANLAEADIAVLRISARKGTYMGLDAGVPLSFDAPFPGWSSDGNLPAAIKDRNRVIDALRVRDGYKKADGTVVAAANPNLKIALVMHMDRPGIVKPFVNGLVTLDEVDGAGSYPMVSDEANIRRDGLGGVDALLADFGAYDRAVLDVVFNKNAPAGYKYGTATLPMEIPSSDAEVEEQFEDVPADTYAPTYKLGSGMVMPDLFK